MAKARDKRWNYNVVVCVRDTIKQHRYDKSFSVFLLARVLVGFMFLGVCVSCGQPSPARKAVVIQFQMERKEVLYWNGRPICDGTIVELHGPITNDAEITSITADGNCIVAGHKLVHADGAPLVFGRDTGSISEFRTEARVLESEKARVEFVLVVISKKNHAATVHVPEWIRILARIEREKGEAKEYKRPKDKVGVKEKTGSQSDGAEQKVSQRREKKPMSEPERGAASEQTSKD